MTFCFQSQLKLFFVGEVCEGLARKQLKLEGMTGDDEVMPGQENRQKCDQQDDILIIDSSRDQSTPTHLENPIKDRV